MTVPHSAQQNRRIAAALAALMLLGGAAVAVGVLAGEPGPAPRVNVADPPVDVTAGVGWSSTEDVLEVVTWGSSSCPRIVAEEATMVRGELVVTFLPDDADGPCTADWSPTASTTASRSRSAWETSDPRRSNPAARSGNRVRRPFPGQSPG